MGRLRIQKRFLYEKRPVENAALSFSGFPFLQNKLLSKNVRKSYRFKDGFSGTLQRSIISQKFVI